MLSFILCFVRTQITETNLFNEPKLSLKVRKKVKKSTEVMRELLNPESQVDDILNRNRNDNVQNAKIGERTSTTRPNVQNQFAQPSRKIDSRISEVPTLTLT